ncbi:ABC transporter ATP-binding protein [Echinicola jeungdonensis]|uniref:ATP-binding cassette domain-containing protein n=1 Tax=Echinicola jeungdonensis TaxID=709343 RepID=A0ABV5JA31_9BACT|nr:ABC transporter ATP-binding protein [Echinicola jeungdonensis]MDN3669915.1 ABC transporter ATP-binding protein [Echinicola jeungdonensis]
MLEIKLEGASKRYQYEWIFKNLDLQAPAQAKIAITGSNGSGKSTFLKCLAGIIPLTEGKIQYKLSDKIIPETDYFKHLTFSAPYMELLEELTLKELLTFHFKFKNPIPGLDINKMIQILYLENAKNKQIQYFSSGMKQRLKLGLCFFSDAPLVLLDEPTSNLDQKGREWYLELADKYGENRMVFIGSNDPKEYSFCDQELSIEDFKISGQRTTKRMM